MAKYSGTIQIDATPSGCGLTVKDKRAGGVSKSFAPSDVPSWVCEICRGNAGVAIVVNTTDGPPETISSVTVG